jgi:hypothetical protein
MMDMVKAQQADLVGEYGDIFWSLSPALAYVAGSEIHCRIYVANVTNVDRSYMMMATLSRDGEVIEEFPIKVDDAVWFSVEANNVVSLPGSLVLGYTDAALTVNLYEKETNEITDSVSTALTSQGTANLPVLPGIPAAPSDMSNLMNILIMFMVVVMMMTMMKRAVE